MRFFTLFILLALLAGCRPDTYTPKPRGYYKVDLPEHEYRMFNEAGFPYSFEYPTYGRIVKDTLFFGKKPENPYWINIDFPEIGSRVYISYKAITPSQPFEKLLEDSYGMAYFHTKRADYIEDQVFHNEANGVHGILYNVGGNAASAYQFIATDSVKHFIRGALYFDVSPNADSLKPMNDFMKKDLERLLQTLSWQ